MRKQIAAANWKMNLSLSEGVALVEQLTAQSYELNENRLVLLGVPSVYLMKIRELCNNEFMQVAAQDCSHRHNGAFTGEVSASMLKSIGVNYVIVGHSERREYHAESNNMLAEKVNRLLEHGLHPVFCCGESLPVREAGTQNEFVGNQLRDSLFHLTPEQMHGFIIAYEPIWAIGTGKTASSQQAQEMHAHIRSVIAAQYGEAVASSVSILYGGSVKAANASELFSNPDVEGGLVGGASLVASEFVTIINSLK
jgi:triosephosphate isomerase